MHLFRQMEEKVFHLVAWWKWITASKCLSQVQFMHRICRAIPAVGRIQHHQLKASQALELKLAALRMVIQILAGPGLLCRESRTDGGRSGLAARSGVGFDVPVTGRERVAVVTVYPNPSLTLPPHCTAQSRVWAWSQYHSDKLLTWRCACFGWVYG